MKFRAADQFSECAFRLFAIGILILASPFATGLSDDLKVAKSWADVIRDEDVSSRRAIVRVLGRTGTEDNLFLVVGAMTDEDSTVRKLSRDTLRANKGPAAYHALERSMPDGNGWEIGLLLAKYTEKKYVGFLCNDLRHKNSRVRAISTFALGRQKALQALPIIRTMSGDPDVSVRREVSVALKEFSSGK